MYFRYLKSLRFLGNGSFSRRTSSSHWRIWYRTLRNHSQENTWRLDLSSDTLLFKSAKYFEAPLRKSFRSAPLTGLLISDLAPFV